MSEQASLKDILVNFDNENAYHVLQDLVSVVGKERVIAAIDEMLAEQSAQPEPYFDDSLPEEYIAGVIYRRNKKAAKR